MIIVLFVFSRSVKLFALPSCVLMYYKLSVFVFSEQRRAVRSVCQWFVTQSQSPFTWAELAGWRSTNLGQCWLGTGGQTRAAGGVRHWDTRPLPHSQVATVETVETGWAQSLNLISGRTGLTHSLSTSVNISTPGRVRWEDGQRREIVNCEGMKKNAVLVHPCLCLC